MVGFTTAWRQQRRHTAPPVVVVEETTRTTMKGTSSTETTTPETVVKEQQQQQQALAAAATTQAVDALERRPDRISVTVFRPNASVSFGCQLEYNEDLGRVCLRGTVRSGSLLDVENPRAEQFTHHHEAGGVLKDDDNDDRNVYRLALQEGDVLEYINDFCCKDKFVGDIQAYLEDLMGSVTFVVSHSSSCSLDEQEGGLWQAIFVRRNNNSSSLQQQQQPPLPCIHFCQEQDMLQIQKVSLVGPSEDDDDSLPRTDPLESVLGPGDLVVAIQTTPSLSLAAQDAEFLWQDASARHGSDDSNTTTICSLTVQKASPQAQQPRGWRTQLRRTVVAVSGGTLVGVGAVMMATPLHPVGHAMTIGGVGVLGTEFEAPRRAVQAATRSIKRTASSSSSKSQGVDKEDNCCTAAASKTAASPTLLQRKSIKENVENETSATTDFADR